MCAHVVCWRCVHSGSPPKSVRAGGRPPGLGRPVRSGQTERPGASPREPAASWASEGGHTAHRSPAGAAVVVTNATPSELPTDRRTDGLLSPSSEQRAEPRELCEPFECQGRDGGGERG